VADAGSCFRATGLTGPRQALMVLISSRTLRCYMSNLDAVFAALSDPTRRAILRRLLRGDASVGELAEPFSLSVRTISKHIAVLENAGLIARESRGQQRLSRLVPKRLAEVDAWLAPYRDVWIERHANIDELVTKLRGKKQ